MLIRKAQELRYSDITPKSVYLRRREFIQSRSLHHISLPPRDFRGRAGVLARRSRKPSSVTGKVGAR